MNVSVSSYLLRTEDRKTAYIREAIQVIKLSSYQVLASRLLFFMDRHSFLLAQTFPWTRRLASTRQHVRHNDVARPNEIVDPGQSMNL